MADIKEPEDDAGITMVEVLEQEEILEQQQQAVLGGSDDKNCTFPTGYVKRQALYACCTCTDSTKALAGICLACSYACHEGHKLVELYTKRNFRCDCGNSKFSSNICKLFPDKDAFNTENHYNQNFRGMYCTCARPYPDPDDDIEDEMIQCVTCEDWFHGRHIGTPVPLNNEYEEMICAHCMSKYDFLWPYSTITKDMCSKEQNETEQVDVEQVDETAPATIPPTSDFKKSEVEKSCENSECFFEKIANNPVTSPGNAVFWPDGWRSKLCRCLNCKTKYTEANVSFLLDDDDTVHSYEEQGKARNAGQSQYDQGLQALSQLDHVKQVEAITEYNDMKGELKDFLKNFAESKKVVQKKDIDEFFAQMHQRKRQRVEVSVPHFCR